MIDESLKNLIIATPVIAVLLYFLKYFIKGYEEEKKVNKQKDEAEAKKSKLDAEIMEGMKLHVQESNKKQDETNNRLSHIIRKLDK